MAVIERLYQRLTDDNEIQGRIPQIKAHPANTGSSVGAGGGGMIIISSPRMMPAGLHTCAARYWPE